MHDALNFLFGRQLAGEEDEQPKRSKSAEFRPSTEFAPSQPYYDPQLRLKQRLRSVLPHVPFLPGLPPRQDDK